MIEVSQTASSPEIASKPQRLMSRKMQLPPRPPPPVEKEPPQVHQWASSEEDLSFADFSNLDEDEGKGTSLSGFLEDPKESYKISAVDVASVGNASDTLISGVSGRDLHERAKAAFNRADYGAALPLFEAILAAQVRRFSALHPSVGAAMHNVGVCRQRMGQHALAENLFQEAVSIRERTLGPDHVEVAASLSKLGAAETALRKFDAAFGHLRKALKIARTSLGHEHKTVAQMLCHTACLYFEAGELMASEAEFQDALEIYRGVWAGGRDSVLMQLTDTLCNVGSIQNRRKRFKEAVASFSEALELQLGIVSHDDSRIISTLDNLGYSYSKLKDYGSALSCYRKMMRAQVSNSGTFTEACWDTFRKMILMMEKTRSYVEAVDEIKEVLQMQRTVLPREHVLIAQTKDLLEEIKQKAR